MCNRRLTLFSLITLAFLMAGVAKADPGAGAMIFSSIPSVLPGNVSSLGAEAVSFREVGDAIALPSGTGGTLASVNVILSSWACTSGAWYNTAPGANSCVTRPNATFTIPITMNIYAVDDSNPALPKAAGLLGTQTSTFQVPYRPSSDPVHCGPNGSPGGDGQ